jgi:hypothetical protein
LADVCAARRALSAKLAPSTQYYLWWGAAFALFCGSTSWVLQLVGGTAIVGATMAATWWQSRRARLVCPSRLQLFSRAAFGLASLLSLVAMAVVLAIAVTLAAALLHPDRWADVISHRGTPIAYLLPFAMFIVPALAAVMLPWHLDPYGTDARPMRKALDQPAALDPVIEPTQRIRVCAMLAGLDWIEAGFFVDALQLSGQEFHRQTAELIAAQYISVHPQDGRWWFGLTAVGRTAYRRHLRALQQVSAGQLAFAVGSGV